MGTYATDISASISIDAIKDQAIALAAIKPGDPNTPQEQSLAGRVLALFEKELSSL